MAFFILTPEHINYDQYEGCIVFAPVETVEEVKALIHVHKDVDYYYFGDDDNNFIFEINQGKIEIKKVETSDKPQIVYTAFYNG